MPTCILVDDEPLARGLLRRFLDERPEWRVLAEPGNGLEAVQAIEDLRPDLAVLDIQMPELDGFGVVEAVGADRMPAALFVTSYEQYALRAFQVHALDYLLKPCGRDRFLEAVDRARSWIEAGSRPSLEPLVSQIRRDRPATDRFLVKDGDKYLFVKIMAIQWVEPEGNYVRLHVPGTSYLLRAGMAGILEKLPRSRFRRIHRSAIVNLDAVESLEPWTGGDYRVCMRDGTRLTLSRSFRDQMAEWL